jgi:hypothetical protein
MIRCTKIADFHVLHDLIIHDLERENPNTTKRLTYRNREVLSTGIPGPIEWHYLYCVCKHTCSYKLLNDSFFVCYVRNGNLPFNEFVRNFLASSG